jgi:hypothetical protein
MKKILLFLCTGLLFLGCDDETQPSGGGQARIIVNCPGFIQGQETLLASSSIGTLYLPGATDLNTVTKGQNVAVSLNYQTPSMCKNVEVKFELNGNVIDTRNLTMGGFDASSTCQDGCYKSLNFIVP